MASLTVVVIQVMVSIVYEVRVVAVIKGEGG